MGHVGTEEWCLACPLCLLWWPLICFQFFTCKYFIYYWTHGWWAWAWAFCLTPLWQCHSQLYVCTGCFYKLSTKNLVWGPLKCTKSNFDPVHVFLHFKSFCLVVLQLILASKLSELEQFEKRAENCLFADKIEVSQTPFYCLAMASVWFWCHFHSFLLSKLVICWKFFKLL